MRCKNTAPWDHLSFFWVDFLHSHATSNDIYYLLLFLCFFLDVHQAQQVNNFPVAVSVLYCIYYVSGVFFWDINTKQGRITITKPIFITSTKPRESSAVKVFLQLAKKVGCLKGQSHKGRVLQKMRDIFSMVILK